jgi:hypothetical protein
MDATADSATCEANRKHVVEESVQALFAPRVPVQKTLATARPPPAVLGPASRWRQHVRRLAASPARTALS